MSRRKARRSRTEVFVPYAVEVAREKCEATGKLMYADPVDAWMVVLNLQGRDAQHRIKQEKRVYKCLFCAHHHTTSEEQRTAVRATRPA